MKLIAIIQKKKLYKELCKPEYNTGCGFYTEDLGENMSLVHESICGWWKPRYLLDHRLKEAFEFLTADQTFARFSDDDVDWSSIRNVPFGARGRAKCGNALFPTHVCKFQDGVARVLWQINPDGRYYMDEDGYGMTDDEEIQLIGAIDRSGLVVKKYYLPEQ